MDFVTARELISYPRLSVGTKDQLNSAWKQHQTGTLHSYLNVRFYVGAARTQQGETVNKDPKSCSPWLPGEPTAPSQFIIQLVPRAPKPAHNVTSSPELLQRRKVQRIAAQELTRSLISVSSIADAKALYESHGEKFNAIHFAALFTALGRLAPGPASSPSHHTTPAASTSRGPDMPYMTTPPPSPPPLLSVRHGLISGPTNAITLPRPAHPNSASGPLKVLSGDGDDGDELRDFVSTQLVPHVGLRLMGFGSRQLVTVLVALAKLDCPPPDFWMSEWLQHFARGMDSPLAAATAASPVTTAGVVRQSYNTAVATAVGRGMAQNVAAMPSEVDRRCTPTSTEMALTMWAIAKLQVRHRQHSSGGDFGAIAPPSAKLAGNGAATGLRHSRRTDGSLTLSSRSTILLPPSPSPSPPHRDVAAGPSLVWLQTVAHAFAAQSSAASGASIASFLWGAARLGYRPPAAAMAALMARCRDLLEENSYGRCCSRGGGGGGGGGIGPRELSEVMWSLAVMGFTPGEAWLRRVDMELERLAGGTEGEGRGGEGLAAVAAAVAVEDKAQEDEEEPQQGVVQLSRAPPKAEPAEQEKEEEGTADWWNDHLSHEGCSSSSSSGVGGGVSHVVRRRLGGALPGGGGGFAPAAAVAAAAPPPLLLDSRHAATCIWAFARLGHRPPARVLTALLRRVCAGAPATAASGAAATTAAAPQDLSMASWALGVLRFQPEPDQAIALVRVMAVRLRDANSQNLVIWLSALARMRLAAPLPWFVCYLGRIERKLRTLSPLALVNWVDAVAKLRTARPPRRSRLELAVRATRWQEQQQKQEEEEEEEAALRMSPAGTEEGECDGGGGGSGGWGKVSSTAVAEVTAVAMARGPVLRKGAAGSCSNRASSNSSSNITRSSSSGSRSGSSNSTRAFEGSSGDSGGFRDRWVLVALPGPKPPRGAATRGPALDQQHQQLHQHQRLTSHICSTARPLAAGQRRPPHSPPSQTSSPPHLTCRPPRTADSATLTAATEEASPATTAAAVAPQPQPQPAPVAQRPGRGSSGPDSVFVRPAVRQLQRHRMMSPLLRLLEARMPYMDLEQHCRLAWAVAHLNTAIRRPWVDSLIAHTSEALERRLKLRQEHHQQQQQQQQMRSDAGAAAAGAGAASSGLEGHSVTTVPAPAAAAAAAAAPVAPVIDARWLLKLVRGVQMMLRGPNRGSGSRRRRRRQRLTELPWGRRLWRLRRHRCRATGEEAAAAPTALSGSATRGGSEPYSYIPRRWRLLLMVAMLPQLSALTNAQLLRFVRTMAQLRWGPAVAAAAARTASSAGSAATAAGADRGFQAAAGGAGGSTLGAANSTDINYGDGRFDPPLRPRRGLQRRVVRELGAYCRRRVAATCGGGEEEACDLTTLELLRWTRGWDSSSSSTGRDGGGGDDGEEDGGDGRG